MAVKRFELSGTNATSMRQVYKEAVILGQLSHPNIVTLYGMVVDPCNSSSSSSSNTRGVVDLHGALVMELMETDLAAYLEDNTELPLRERWEILGFKVWGLSDLLAKAYKPNKRTKM